MAMTRAEHRAKAETLMARYENTRIEDPTKLLLAAIAHAILGADGLPRPT